MAINHGLKYFETSAKENINLDKAFYEMSKDIFYEVNKYQFSSFLYLQQ